MIARIAAATVQARLASHPAVAIIGPRQCGKTTLARTLGAIYYDLEQESDRLRLDLEWADVVQARDLVVLDEAQSWPAVFPRLRGAIDADRSRTGRFLLLGSVSPALMTQVSESLAGRLALVELTPLLVNEMTTAAAAKQLWLTGGFPDGGILRPRAFPTWQTDYLRLLVQRDLPTWGLPAAPQVTQRLLRMLAAVHGQTWNASQIGKSLGISYHTANSYLDYLDGAFLVRRLPAYHTNLKKRVVKSPKIYWRDSGLLHSLLNVPDRSALLSKPWVGASWEGFVIDQTLGHLAAYGVPHDAYFLRTSDQQEIDLLLEVRGELWAIEVKLTTSPSPIDMKRLDRLADLLGATRRYLISQTPKPAGDEHRASADLPWLLRQIAGLAPSATAPPAPG